MLNLNDREWKEFFIGGNEGVFKITSSSSGIDKGKLLKADEANVPYVTRSDKNNGIDLFVTKQNKKVDLKNVITIGLDTQTIFYQPHAFYTGQNIQVLSNPFLNKYVAMFIIPLLKSQMVKFNWGGNGATLTRLNRTKLLLPVDNNKNPDYEFMEQYIKEQESRKREEYIQHIKNELHDIEYKEIKKWEELEWKTFRINDIFSVSGTTTTAPLDLIPNGKTPRITCSSINNALDNTYQNTATEKGGVLTIDSATIGSVTYQEVDFIATDHVEKLTLRDRKMNKYIGLFFVSVISSAISQKYDYGYKFNQFRIKRQIISLPVNSFGIPDYEYIEQYMKNIIYLRDIQYLIERGIENNDFKLAHVYSCGWGAVMGYVLPSSTLPEEQIKEIIFKPHTGFMFEIKKRLLTITLNFEEVEKFDFYFSNLFCKEIATAINTGAIKIVFRTPKDEDMDEYSEGYSERTTIVLDYLTRYQINCPDKIWKHY